MDWNEIPYLLPSGENMAAGSPHFLAPERAFPTHLKFNPDFSSPLFALCGDKHARFRRS